jgi:hypothetical protein
VIIEIFSRLQTLTYQSSPEARCFDELVRRQEKRVSLMSSIFPTAKRGYKTLKEIVKDYVGFYVKERGGDPERSSRSALSQEQVGEDVRQTPESSRRGPMRTAPRATHDGEEEKARSGGEGMLVAEAWREARGLENEHFDKQELLYEVRDLFQGNWERGLSTVEHELGQLLQTVDVEAFAAILLALEGGSM